MALTGQGYVAWALGFALGIWIPYQPAVLYSFFVGLVVYAALAKAGLRPGSGRSGLARRQTACRAKGLGRCTTLYSSVRRPQDG